MKKTERRRIDAFILWSWRLFESPLDSKEIKSVHPRGNPSWMFIGRTDAEAETPILWPPDVKSWLIGKDLDAGKGWRQEEKGVTEDEMIGWHHRLEGHEFEQTLGGSEGQGNLACCSPYDWTTAGLKHMNFRMKQPLSLFKGPWHRRGQKPWCKVQGWSLRAGVESFG